MNWQPGQWIECKQTQETGKIESYNGKRFRVILGDGITLYITPQALANLGWRPIQLDQVDDINFKNDCSEYFP